MLIATWNVNSLRVRLTQLKDWLAANPVDVMVLQVDSGLAALACGLLDNSAFGEAVAQAFSADPDFNPSKAMALLIRHGLLVGTRHQH